MAVLIDFEILRPLDFEILRRKEKIIMHCRIKMPPTVIYSWLGVFITHIHTQRSHRPQPPGASHDHDER